MYRFYKKSRFLIAYWGGGDFLKFGKKCRKFKKILGSLRKYDIKF